VITSPKADLITLPKVDLITLPKVDLITLPKVFYKLPMAYHFIKKSIFKNFLA
jgi:hypothetical protein